MSNFDVNRATQQYIDTIRESNRLVAQALDIIQENNRDLAHFINMGMLNNRITSTRILTGRLRRARTMGALNRTGTTDVDVSSLTPVVVAPTRLQVCTSTRLKIYGDIENPQTETCPITQEPFQSHDLVLEIIHCGHLFDRAALNRWFSTNVHCPLCRYDIREYSAST